MTPKEENDLRVLGELAKSLRKEASGLFKDWLVSFIVVAWFSVALPLFYLNREYPVLDWLINWCIFESISTLTRSVLRKKFAPGVALWDNLVMFVVTSFYGFKMTQAFLQIFILQRLK